MRLTPKETFQRCCSGCKVQRKRKNEVAVNKVNINQVENATDQLIAYLFEWLALKKSVAWIMRLQTILLGLARNRKEIRRDIHEVGSEHIEQQETEKERMAELRVREKTDHVALTIQELQICKCEISDLTADQVCVVKCWLHDSDSEEWKKYVRNLTIAVLDGDL